MVRHFPLNIYIYHHVVKDMLHIYIYHHVVKDWPHREISHLKCNPTLSLGEDIGISQKVCVSVNWSLVINIRICYPFYFGKPRDSKDLDYQSRTNRGYL